MPTFTVKTRFHTEAREYSNEVEELEIGLPSGRTASVSLYGPDTHFGGDHVPPKVNWSAIGSVSPEDAEAFGHAMVYAATRATQLSGPTGSAE